MTLLACHRQINIVNSYSSRQPAALSLSLSCPLVLNRVVPELPDFGSGSGKSGIHGHFSEIRASPAPAKFLAGFGGCQTPVQLQYVQLITDNTNAAKVVYPQFWLVLLGRWKYKIHCRSTNFVQNYRKQYDATKETVNINHHNRLHSARLVWVLHWHLTSNNRTVSIDYDSK